MLFATSGRIGSCAAARAAGVCDATVRPSLRFELLEDDVGELRQRLNESRARQARLDRARDRAERVRFFIYITEHADGERRGPASVRRYRETRLAATFPMPPSDSI